MSEFNYQAEVICAQTFGYGSPQMNALESDPDMADPELHPIGTMQCEINAPKIQTFDFKYVLVSPF